MQHRAVLLCALLGVTTLVHVSEASVRSPVARDRCEDEDVGMVCFILVADHPVCGSDGKTYPNQCAFAKAQCRSPVPLWPRCRFQPCSHCTKKELPVGFPDFNLPKLPVGFPDFTLPNVPVIPVPVGQDYHSLIGDRCKEDGIFLKGACFPWLKRQFPVCATDGNTYPSNCEFFKAQCRNTKLRMLCRRQGCSECERSEPIPSLWDYYDPDPDTDTDSLAQDVRV